MNRYKMAHILLRIGITCVFLYAAIGSFLTPDNWIGYFPLFLRSLLPENLLLLGFSIYELFLSLWLLSGKKTFYAALLSAMTLSGIIIFNLSLLDIIFRDFAILLSAAALTALSFEKNSPSHE